MRATRSRSSLRGSFRTRVALVAWVCFAGAVAGMSGRAGAHPESFSMLLLGLRPQGLHASMTLPIRDLSRWFPPGRHPDYVADVVRELRGEADELLEVTWDTDAGPARPLRASVHAGGKGFIVAELDYPIPPGAAALQVRSACLANLPNDHQQATSIQDDRAASGAAGRVLAQETLTSQQDTLNVDLPAEPTAPAEQAAPAPEGTARPAAAAVIPPAALAPAKVPALSAAAVPRGGYSLLLFSLGAVALLLTFIFRMRRAHPVRGADRIPSEKE